MDECFRHGKPIETWGVERTSVQRTVPWQNAPGSLTADDPSEAGAPLLELLEQHRVWDRFDA